MEWARSRARALHWLEEVGLLCEEMRRSLEFCAWSWAWWQGKLTSRETVDLELQEGLASYAHERMQAELNFSNKWSTQWSIVHRHALAFVTPGADSELENVPTIVEIVLPDLIEDE